MTQPDDASIIQQVREGDKDAFGILIERHYPMVYRLACRVIGHPDLAQDRAQEACLQAFLSLDSLRDPSAFQSWVYGITLNVCHAYLRQQKPTITLDDTLVRLLQDKRPSPEAITQQRESDTHLREAIRQLSARNQEAIVLYYFQGLTQQAIAQELSISVTAVKGRLHKARQQLKSMLYTAIYPVGVSASVNHHQRGNTMATQDSTLIPIRIIDTPFQVVTSDDGKQRTLSQLLLFNEETRRAMVIWVDEYLATTIALSLQKSDEIHTFTRPTSHDLMGHLLKASGATIESVIINDLRENVYYATVRLQTENGIQAIDARPSDSIALAVRHDVPIYATEKLWQVASPPIPADKSPNRSGIHAIMQRIQAEGEARKAFFQQIADNTTSRDAYTVEVRQKARAIIDNAFD
ncbi:MAG: bifunctional nuclease domain-containing protein [Chloroflexota bacterium]